MIDSGACTSVTGPQLFPGVPIHESAASKDGTVYSGIGGEEMKKQGEIAVKMCAIEGELKQSVWQVADGVTRTLTATNDICTQGNWVLRDDKGGWIINKKTHEATRFGVNDDVYEMEFWAQVFTRQE